MKTIIFGCGFVGKRLLKLIPEALTTELPHLCSSDQIAFNFKDRETWKNIPDFDQAVITFKIDDSELSYEFAKLFVDKKVILLSSARNIKNFKPDEEIDESFPLKEIPRVNAENHFSENATILYLGLIWGENRSPKKWISEGRIKNGNKYINLINANDLCKIILYLFKEYCDGVSYLVSDGEPQKWSEIAENFGESLNCKDTGLESRKFNTEKLKSKIPNDFIFTSLNYS